MLAFFRRTPSAAPDSNSNRDARPPPSPGKRQQKEKAWLSSISAKSSSSASSTTPPASTRNTTSRRGDKATPNVAQQGLKPAPSLRPQPSSTSLKSSATRRSFFSNPLKGKAPAESATEDHERRRPPSTYAASAPSRSGGVPRSHSPPPPLPPSLPPPTTTDTTTKSLATRLQELSIANADGLLDDEEYRMLRTRLFETYAAGAAGGDQENKSLLVEGKEAVPRLGGGSRGASTSTLRAPSASNTPPSSPPQSQRAPSLLSTTSSRRPSLNNLFRRGSASLSNGKTGPITSLSDDWDLVPETTGGDRSDVASVLSGRSGRGLGSGGTGRSRVLSNVPESPTMASLAPSVDSSPVRTRSVRHHPALASVALSPRGESGGRFGTGSSQGSGGGGRGGTESLFSAGSDGGGGTTRSSYSYSPSQTARGGSTIHSTSSRSIFPSSASTISQSISSSSLLPPIPSSSDPFLFASVGKEPSSKELREEIEEIEQEGEEGEGENAKGIETIFLVLDPLAR
ncbi:hypothetical protein BCR35DRAFT_86668 [Leucosporidium creatinivorum]|uniref:Uncharacterized protein n=1 Tax=Leucosporidium creatinivorum TaxID=106004 RepID=A0A1Y2FEF3_9BASI|nr:hypothetical protein BCR35DRAFT_86668 [Leucosporidium creatinivorum]